MMRGEREIALTTPVSLTAFQPSLGRIISVTVPVPKGFRGWLPSQVPTGLNPTGSWASLFRHFMA
jgi:hypothetical protein